MEYKCIVCRNCGLKEKPSIVHGKIWTGGNFCYILSHKIVIHKKIPPTKNFALSYYNQFGLSFPMIVATCV